MKTAVIITANPNTNEVFNINKNADGTTKLGKDGEVWGTIRVQQTQLVKNGNILQPKVISALIPISQKSYDVAKTLLKEGSEFGGQIVRKETTETNADGSPLLGYREKRAGSEENAPLCTVGGKTIYQTTFHTEDMSVSNELVAHDNVTELKAFRAAQVSAPLNVAGN